METPGSASVNPCTGELPSESVESDVFQLQPELTASQLLEGLEVSSDLFLVDEGYGDGDADAHGNADTFAAPSIPITPLGEMSTRTNAPSMHGCAASPHDSSASSGNSDHDAQSPDTANEIEIDTSVSTTARNRTGGNAPRKPRRGNKKDEILSLRNTVHQLEKRLITLYGQKRPFLPGNNTSSSAASRLGSTWENTAMRQFEQRCESEMENVHLRAMLESQLNIKARLERVLFHAYPQVERRMAPADTAPRSKRTCFYASGASPLMNRSLVADLRNSLPSMIERVDSVLSDPRFSSLSRQITLCKDEFVGASVEVVSTSVFPFSFQQTAEAMWRMNLDRVSATNVVKREDSHVTEDTIVTEFECIFDKPGTTSGDFDGKLVTRRFVAADRAIVVWSMVIEPNLLAGTPITGATVRFQGWDVVQPATNSAQPASILRSFHVATPEAHGHRGERREKAGALTEYVMKSVDYHLDSEHKAIEKLLFGHDQGNSCSAARDK